MPKQITVPPKSFEITKWKKDYHAITNKENLYTNINSRKNII